MQSKRSLIELRKESSQSFAERLVSKVVGYPGTLVKWADHMGYDQKEVETDVKPQLTHKNTM